MKDRVCVLLDDMSDSCGTLCKVSTTMDNDDGVVMVMDMVMVWIMIMVGIMMIVWIWQWCGVEIYIEICQGSGYVEGGGSKESHR